MARAPQVSGLIHLPTLPKKQCPWITQGKLAELEEEASTTAFLALASVADAVEWANCLEKCETVRSILRNQSQPTVEVLADALIESLLGYAAGSAYTGVG